MLLRTVCWKIYEKQHADTETPCDLPNIVILFKFSRLSQWDKQTCDMMLFESLALLTQDWITVPLASTMCFVTWINELTVRPLLFVYLMIQVKFYNKSK